MFFLFINNIKNYLSVKDCHSTGTIFSKLLGVFHYKSWLNGNILLQIAKISIIS